MSMMACSYCEEFRDTDDGEGEWDVPRVSSAKKYDFICGCCAEKYLNEDAQFDPDLPEKEHYHNEGLRMAALAEDQSRDV